VYWKNWYVCTSCKLYTERIAAIIIVFVVTRMIISSLISDRTITHEEANEADSGVFHD
jgi:hypothetical protein